MAQDIENTQNAGLETVLSSVLSDPESMNRLASMASALASSGVLSGLMGGDNGNDAKSGDTPTTENANTDGNGIPQALGTSEKKLHLHGVSGRHAALLRAIKPYLGAEKQARIDRMMKLLQLAELADTVLRGS